MLNRSRGTKNLVLLMCCCLFAAIFLISLTPRISLEEEITTESQCVICHTDLSKIIRLSWQIEKIRPMPGKSAETSGEG